MFKQGKTREKKEKKIFNGSIFAYRVFYLPIFRRIEGGLNPPPPFIKVLKIVWSSEGLNKGPDGNRNMENLSVFTPDPPIEIDPEQSKKAV